MEKVITSEHLESTWYRCLFDVVKKEGILPVIKLIQDIKNYQVKKFLFYKQLQV